MKIKIMSKITQAFIESLANSSLDSGKVDSDETKKEDNCIDRKIDATGEVFTIKRFPYNSKVEQNMEN